MSVAVFLTTDFDFGGDRKVPLKEFHLLEDAIRNRNAIPFMIDLSEYPDGPPTTALADGTLTVDGTTVRPADLSSAVIFPQCLFRHFYYKEWDELLDDPIGSLNQLREYRGLFSSVLAILADQGVRLTCPPAAFTNQQRKLWQTHAFAQRGIPTPDTIITTDPDEAESFVEEHDRAVAKPVAGGFVPQLLTPDDLTNDRRTLIRKTPVQFQTYAPGDDIRVYVVGKRTVGAIRYTNADETFSIKAVEDNDVGAVRFDAPERMCQAAETAVNACALRFGVVDIRYDPETDALNVLEVNPGGRFMLAEQAGVNVSGHLADWLVTKR